MAEPLVIPPKKTRCIALIDGFNLYHAINDCPHFGEYKWLNLDKLCKGFLDSPAKSELLSISFFTALPPWDEGKKARHLRLLGVYADLGIRVIPGKFLPTTAHCRLCDKVYDTYQEKLTDINITIEMLRIGHENLADRIYLVTGDNDQASGVRRFRSLYNEKEVVVVVPPYRKAKELTDSATSKRTLSESSLAECVLDDPYTLKDGRQYTKPPNWKNAPHPGPNWRPRERETKRCH